MKVINLNSKFELTQAQISFAESVIICGEDEPIREDDSISLLMNEIPIFLLSPESMPDDYSIYHETVGSKESYPKEENKEYRGEEKPSTEWLGFYQNSYRILNIEKPIIGLCPERIIKCVNSDEELIILIAKIIIHEFAHAKMKLHPRAIYKPIDEFYKWMEEPMANVITLEYFRNFDRCYRYRRNGGEHFAHVNTSILPFDFVKGFISKQPDNYRLGLDLFEQYVSQWWIWRNQKDEIQKKTKEKQNWLNYVKANVGKTDKKILDRLFDDLYKFPPHEDK